MAAYYNENNPHAAKWLRHLIAKGFIAPGTVDERSIIHVRPDDLLGYTQCHFFAGIGGWSRALRLAGWPDSRPVWTASCPCQPFSAAGKGTGLDDQRHLWPALFHIVSQQRPAVIFGEQVSNKTAEPWVDLVQADLEGMAYLFGAVSLPAACCGAPHIRERVFWLGHAISPRLEGLAGDGLGAPEWPQSTGPAIKAGALDGWEPVRFAAECDPDGDGWCQVRDIDPAECDCIGPTEDDVDYKEVDGVLYGRRTHPGALDNTQRHGWGPGRNDDTGDDRGESAAAGPVGGFWSDADWLPCTDNTWRPVEPGTFPLAHGIPRRVVTLRGYGNAIVPQVAEQFIRAYLDTVKGN